MSTQNTPGEEGEAPDVLEPIQTERIPFQGRELLAVRLADGRIAAAVRWLCEGLGLDPVPQMRRIRRTKAIRGDLLTVRFDTPGGKQVMPALTVRALPFWLAGLDTSRLSPELEPVILAYQLECVDVLYRYFAERPRELAAPPELVNETQIERPEKPPKDAAAELWAEYHERMAEWIRWQADISAWRQGVDTWREGIEGRLESIEEVQRLVPELLDRLGPQMLTTEHQRTIQNLAKRLHDMTGYAYSTIYGELIGDFHVPRYTEIAEARWEEVGAWFQVRFDAAQKRSGTHGQH